MGCNMAESAKVGYCSKRADLPIIIIIIIVVVIIIILGCHSVTPTSKVYIALSLDCMLWNRMTYNEFHQNPISASRSETWGRTDMSSITCFQFYVS
jgi:hypothetical protein